MLADDATTMAHYGNFTFYGKSCDMSVFYV